MASIFYGNLFLYQNTNVSLVGGFDSNYADNQDYTRVHGKLTIASGSVALNRIILAPDTTLPGISSTSPANGSTMIDFNYTLTATFNKSMNAATLNDSTFTLRDSGNNTVIGTVAYSGNSAMFTPLSSLADATTYTATVTTGVRDLAGHSLPANYSWSLLRLRV